MASVEENMRTKTLSYGCDARPGPRGHFEVGPHGKGLRAIIHTWIYHTWHDGTTKQQNRGETASSNKPATWVPLTVVPQREQASNTKSNTRRATAKHSTGGEETTAVLGSHTRTHSRIAPPPTQYLVDRGTRPESVVHTRACHMLSMFAHGG